MAAAVVAANNVCHAPRRRPWGYKPLNVHDLVPMLGYEDRDWTDEELPAMVEKCGWCAGRGRYEQTYTVGCGGGYYRSMGKCDWCGGLGLTYLGTPPKIEDGIKVPLSVINQIVVARERNAAHTAEEEREVA